MNKQLSEERAMSHQLCQSTASCSCKTDVHFASISYLRIGSAHAQCQPKFDAVNIDLMLRLCSCTLGSYETDQLPAQVQLHFLDDGQLSEEPHLIQAMDNLQDKQATPQQGFCISAQQRMLIKFQDRRWLRYLFVSVLAKGSFPCGSPGYCYFALFADQLVKRINRPASDTRLSIPEYQGVVIRSGRGKPSPFTREWMYQHFHFSPAYHANLEISRHSPTAGE